MALLGQAGTRPGLPFTQAALNVLHNFTRLEAGIALGTWAKPGPMQETLPVDPIAPFRGVLLLHGTALDAIRVTYLAAAAPPTSPTPTLCAWITGWVCGTCTLGNPTTATKCEGCWAPRGHAPSQEAFNVLKETMELHARWRRLTGLPCTACGAPTLRGRGWVGGGRGCLSWGNHNSP